MSGQRAFGSLPPFTSFFSPTAMSHYLSPPISVRPGIQHVFTPLFPAGSVPPPHRRPWVFPRPLKIPRNAILFPLFGVPLNKYSPMTFTCPKKAFCPTPTVLPSRDPLFFYESAEVCVPPPHFSPPLCAQWPNALTRKFFFHPWSVAASLAWFKSPVAGVKRYTRKLFSFFFFFFPLIDSSPGDSPTFGSFPCFPHIGKPGLSAFVTDSPLGPSSGLPALIFPYRRRRLFGCRLGCLFFFFLWALWASECPAFLGFFFV